MNHLGFIIAHCNSLDCFEYHRIIKLYGKEVVQREIDAYIEKRLREDFSFENQKLLWNKFGYYLATLEDSVFVQMAICNLSISDRERGGLSLADEKRYGYQLLCFPYLDICLDDRKNRVDMRKVLASIHTTWVRDFILNQFDVLYQNTSMTSNVRENEKMILNDYKKLCLDSDIPVIDYDGKLLEEDVLVEQVLMYIRYCGAKEQFIQNNMGLIYNVVNKINGLGIGKEDLCQEGYFGLLSAIEKYDVRRGALFSGYAMKGIQFYLWNYVANYSRLVRLPVRVEELKIQIEHAREVFYSKFYRNPSLEELTFLVGISLDRLKDVLSLTYCFHNLSLDSEFLMDDSEEDSGMSLMDFVVDERGDYSLMVVDRMYMDYIDKLMNSLLSEREREVLVSRISGFTLKEIGQKMNISDEGVRKIEIRSIKKLKKVLN